MPDAERAICPECGAENARLTARNTDPTPAWPDNTQLLQCRDCAHRWAFTNGVKV